MGGQMGLYSIYCGSVVYKDKEDKERMECGQKGEEKDTQAIALADLQEVFVGHQSAHATLQRVIGCIKCAPAIFFALFGGCVSAGLSTVARQTNPNRSCHRAGDVF